MEYNQEDLEKLFSGKTIKPVERAQNISENWENKVNSIIEENDQIIFLRQIVVREPERGVGRAFMEDLSNYADSVKKPIFLEPSAELGGKLDRLIKFYSRLGFVEDGNYMRRDPR